MISEVSGKRQAMENESEELTRLLDLELIQKRAAWKRAAGRHRTCPASAQNKQGWRFCSAGTDRNLHDALGRVARLVTRPPLNGSAKSVTIAFILPPSRSQRRELSVRILTETLIAPRLPISSRLGNARPSPNRLIPWP